MKTQLIFSILLIISSIIMVCTIPSKSYNENSGSWSAGEKRQVIMLLQEIADNTRR